MNNTTTTAAVYLPNQVVNFRTESVAPFTTKKVIDISTDGGTMLRIALEGGDEIAYYGATFSITTTK